MADASEGRVQSDFPRILLVLHQEEKMVHRSDDFTFQLPSVIERTFDSIPSDRSNKRSAACLDLPGLVKGSTSPEILASLRKDRSSCHRECRCTCTCINT